MTGTCAHSTLGDEPGTASTLQHSRNTEAITAAATAGNGDCHIILRGGRGPNYDAGSVARAADVAVRARVRPAIMIDASHANSAKDPDNQPRVVEEVARQVEAGCFTWVRVSRLTLLA